MYIVVEDNFFCDLCFCVPNFVNLDMKLSVNYNNVVAKRIFWTAQNFQVSINWALNKYAGELILVVQYKIMMV